MYNLELWRHTKAISISLKIVQITGSFPPMPCGVGDNTHELAKRLANLGHEIDIITSKRASNDSPHEKIRIHPIMAGWSSLFGGLLLKRILSLEPDIVHLQYPTKAYGWGFAPSLLGMQLKSRKIPGPFIVTLHEFAHAHPLRKAAIMPLLSEATMVIFPSDQEKIALHRRFDTLKKIPSRVIPIGAVLPENYETMLIELEKNRDNLIHKWRIPRDGIIVNYGFLHKHKGFETLLKAFEVILSSGYKCELWHVGAFDPHRRSYDRFIQFVSGQGGLKDRVKFKGFLPLNEAAEIFSIARIGVFPFTDGYSDKRSSMITFGHFNAPMITTHSSSGEVNERIKKFVTLVYPKDEEELVEKMEEIIANDALYQHACENASGFKELYDWDKIAKMNEQVYIDLLKDRPIGMPQKIYKESEIIAEYFYDDKNGEDVDSK